MIFSQRSKLCIYFILVITISLSHQQQRRPPQRPNRLPPRRSSDEPNRQGLPPPPSRGSSTRLSSFKPPNAGSGRNRPRPPSKFNRPNKPPPLPELNRPSRQPNEPFLLRGFDLIDFEIAEDTEVGEEVYTLKASQPSSDRGNGKLLYTISGDYFTVDSNTGVIRLRDKLDREKQDKIDVVVTIQDESYTIIVPHHREITVLDVNDNEPQFLNSPYSFAVDETVSVGDTLFASVGVRDLDTGLNGIVDITCDTNLSPEACEIFEIKTQAANLDSIRFPNANKGSTYLGLVVLKKPLDYEERSSYEMVIRAQDRGLKQSLSSTTNILIEINDIQDQPPQFLNAPYTETVAENTSPGTKIFKIDVRDGDTGKPRRIELSIIGDNLGFFTLEDEKYDESTGRMTAWLTKSKDNILDREHPTILADGGLYAFQIRAKEILDPNDPPPIGKNQLTVTTNVTIVVTDVDDLIPRFNHRNFTVAVPEDVGTDTPLPDLNIIVNDGDTSKNAEYDLVIQDIKNAEGVFTVYPQRAIGRTPVIIRVSDPDRLDYEVDDGRRFVFRVNAVNTVDGKVLSTAEVSVIVIDSNDNIPIFEKENYEFFVKEDSQSGDLVGSIVATDADSSIFGQIEYALRGFGAERFHVNNITGEIFVNGCGRQIARACLDFETQKIYSLIYTGTDGGGQVTTTGVRINIEDVNDNLPRFEENDYARVIEEDADHFEPPLIIRATDLDGPNQGGGKVFYEIKSINTDATVFSIDNISGEITMVQPVRSELVEAGQFSIVIRATDGGNPPLHSDIQVKVDVGSASNLIPQFSKYIYEAFVDENAEIGASVVRVKAVDPDGPDDKIIYSLHSGAKDNFIIGPKTGIISVAADSNLDIQKNGWEYNIKVRAEDIGKPFHRFGEAVVSLNVRDINNKAPKFGDDFKRTIYVQESTPVGEIVVQLSAHDDDINADLEFDIVEPIRARDKTGNILTNRAAYDFGKAFRIDPESGEIRVNEPLSYNSAAVIVITVKVEDKNVGQNQAENVIDTLPEYDEYIDVRSTSKLSDDIEGSGTEGVATVNTQVDTAEITFYVQAYKADSPQFSAPWTPSDPNIEFVVKEELPPSSVLFKLIAMDPITNEPITNFEKIQTSDPNSHLLLLSPETGEVLNSQILDFERIKEVVFHVRAHTLPVGVPGQDRTSEARITIKLQDINDNPPVFQQPYYEISIPESMLPNSLVMTVNAVDEDTNSFSEIRYSIDGEGSDVFTIQKETGIIQVKAGQFGRSNLDREKQSMFKLNVLATDMNGAGGPEQLSTPVDVIIHIEDVNDSPPKFSRSRYSSVVPENSQINTLVVRVTATDPDLGDSGEVFYSLVDASLSNSGSYRIDENTGEIFTNDDFTGKGRQAPYVLIVRATDKGVPQLFTDTEVYVTVGDVSSNDGVPAFLRPQPKEVAYIAENSRPGTKVFQVEAVDPDDPQTANGQLLYSLPEDGADIRRLFFIDPSTGLLTTKVKLDREERSNYTLIIDVSDLGSPQQQTSTVLTVIVKDEDDHVPQFNRQRNSVPMEIEVREEMRINSTIGQVKAVDEDLGENSDIEYAIIDGNDNKIFEIKRGSRNEGVLKVVRRLDREQSGIHLLTIRCFRPFEKSTKSIQKRYDSSQLDEMRIKIIVKDIDDNMPRFLPSYHNMTLGVRVNAPVYTEITTLKAVDPDPDALPVQYDLLNVTFLRPRSKSGREVLPLDLFLVDRITGTVQTNKTYGRFGDGYFTLYVLASNQDNKRSPKVGPGFDATNVAGDIAKLKIYVLQDTDLMRFVFDNDPSTVQKQLLEFSDELGRIYSPQPLKFNIYETEFYSQVDGSLDFGRTSSCFQIVSEGQDVIDMKETEKLLDTSQRPRLKDLLQKYEIINIERCAQTSSHYKTGWIEICLLVIGASIGLLAIIAAFVICCLYSRYKRLLHRHSPVKIIETPIRALIPASLPPGSIHGGMGFAPSGMATPRMGMNGRMTPGGGRPNSVMGGVYDWQDGGLDGNQGHGGPMGDNTSYHSLPHQ